MLQAHYIFTGSGLSALMTVYEMLLSEKFKDKTILLIDENSKKTNDRTWCFWEKGQGFFDPIVHKRWDKVWFHGEGFSKQFNIAPYQYKMIRGIDNVCTDSGIMGIRNRMSGLYMDFLHSDGLYRITSDQQFQLSARRLPSG